MDVVTKPSAQEEADPKQPLGALRKCRRIPKISSVMNQVQEQNSEKQYWKKILRCFHVHQ